MSDKDFVTSPDATIKMELLSSRIAWFATNQNDKELLPKIVGLASTILTSCIHFFEIGGFQLRKLVNIHFKKHKDSKISRGTFLGILRISSQKMPISTHGISTKGLSRWIRQAPKGWRKQLRSCSENCPSKKPMG